tara:strand:- start:2026 stop:2343 length:318 start_codon:yes stop_codon:yes gene_type:complete
MEQLAWSNGSKAVKSRKEDKIKHVPQKQENDSSDDSNVSDDSLNKPIEREMIFREASTKREDANDKISERDLIGQTCQNPFFGRTNYVEDLDIQQNFLIPRSSHG